MSKLNVMIVGQKWLGEQLFKQCLANSKINVVAVSPPSLTDRLALFASQSQIPIILHGKTLNASQIPFKVDVILTAHAYCFITKTARDKATHGAVGYHPSLLPSYKGKNAIKDAFANGEQVMGGSLYQLDDGWDTGQVLLQASVIVDHIDTLTTLWQDKLAPLGLRLFTQYLDTLC